ncbi:TPA: hypothetical protein ACYUXQ_004146 [Escherichia coli]
MQQYRHQEEKKSLNQTSIIMQKSSNDIQKNLIQNSPVNLPISNSRSRSPSIEGQGEIERMERCRHELDALKKINQHVYAKRRGQFDLLVSKASIYNSVRSDVGNLTRNTVDAFYRYKSEKLCADIANDVLNGLTNP